MLISLWLIMNVIVLTFCLNGEFIELTLTLLFRYVIRIVKKKELNFPCFDY